MITLGLVLQDTQSKTNLIEKKKIQLNLTCFISELGLTGVPVFNTNNNCSSASSALMLARLLVLSGQYRCVLALGRWLHFLAINSFSDWKD